MRPSRLPIDRLLTDEERNNQLQQKRRLNLKTENLHDNLSVIKLNDTYLETVDKYYSDRGILSCFLLFLEGVFIVTLTIVFIKSLLSHKYLWDLFFAVSILFLFFGVFVWFILRPDSFCYTHYPIRFNRKTKKVYAFTRDQGVVIGDWDKLFFTLDYYRPTSAPGKVYAIRGHILSEDGKTVISSFEAGFNGFSLESTLDYWEFIRRYMEEGAKSVAPIVEYCLPIAEQKASWRYEVIYPFGHNFLYEPKISVYLFSPFTIAVVIGRLFAMWTSKRPIWSDGIEQACIIDTNAEINLTAAINQPWSWKCGWTKNPWWKRMADPKDYENSFKDE